MLVLLRVNNSYMSVCCMWNGCGAPCIPIICLHFGGDALCRLLASLEGIVDGGVAKPGALRLEIDVYKFSLLGSPVTVDVLVEDDLSEMVAKVCASCDQLKYTSSDK